MIVVLAAGMAVAIALAFAPLLERHFLEDEDPSGPDKS